MLGSAEETSFLADCRSSKGKNFLGEDVRDARTPTENSEEIEESYEK